MATTCDHAVRKQALAVNLIGVGSTRLFNEPLAPGGGSLTRAVERAAMEGTLVQGVFFLSQTV